MKRSCSSLSSVNEEESQLAIKSRVSAIQCSVGGRRNLTLSAKLCPGLNVKQPAQEPEGM